MSEYDDGGPAFPTQFDYGPNGHQTVEGMSLRDWFAGQALAGLVQVAEVRLLASKLGEKTGKVTAGAAYEYADAMLAARNSTPTKGA